VFGRLCWLLAAETLAARASAESRGDDPETIESSGAIVAQVARSRVPASLVAKAVTTLAGDDAAIGTGDRVAGVTVGWLHLSRLRIHEPPALTWVRITPSLLVRFPDAKALLGELQAWLGDKYGNPPVPGSAIGEASTSETARQPDGLEQEVKDSAALAPSSDGPTTGQAQAATVFALDPSLSDPYLRESDVKLLEAWQYFAKERGAHPNRYPSPQELADKAAISVHQAKKSLARLRELKRIPHSVRSRRAAVRKATLRSAPQ
jgi:hypothetical protein